MTIKINISKPDVYNEVSKLTSYIGDKSQGEGIYDRVRTTDENEEILSEFFKTALQDVLVTLREYLISFSETEQAVDITLNVVTNGELPLLQTRLPHSILSCIINSIVSHWFCLIDIENAKLYADKSAKELETALLIINNRKRPKRP